MRNLALTIILVQSLACFEYAPKGQNLSPLVAPFTKELPLKQVDEFYTNFASEYLFLPQQFKGDIKNTLNLMVHFDWQTLKLSHLGSLTPEEIRAQIMTVYSNQEKDILAEKFGNLLAEMKKLSRAIVMRAIQLNRVNELEDLVITENTLKQAGAEYKTANKMFPVKVNAMSRILAKDLEPFNAEMVSNYIHFLVFQQQPLQVFEDLCHAVLGGIRSGEIKITNSNRQISLDTLTELLVSTSFMYSPDTRSFEFLAVITREEVRSGCQSSNAATKSFFTSLYSNILTLFGQTHSVSNLNEAKRLFVEYFLPEDYLAPSSEYLRFLMLKYVEEKLKAGSPESGSFAKLQKVYLIDLLFTSVHHKFELIPEKQVREVLGNFNKIVDLVNVKDMANFNHFRNLIIFNSDLLERYEQFFNSFYNLGLFFAQYASWNNIETTSQSFAASFDSFLEDVIKREGGLLTTLWNGSLPDETMYDLSLSENYVAYKLINMQTFPSQLSKGSGDIKFSNYEDLQDKNIEELLFENGKFTDLILTLKEIYLNNKALNYGVFAKLSVDAGFWRRLREISPSLFESKTIVNII